MMLFMMKKDLRRFKKVFAILLTLILVFSFSAPVYADLKSKISKDVQDEIVKTLNLISYDKVNYGNIDFNTLSIGDAIYSYELSDKNLKKIDYVLYPLISSGKLIAFAIKHDNQKLIEITTTFVNDLQLNFNQNEAFSFIYDKNTCYVYTSKGLKQIYKDNKDNKSRDVLDYRKVDKSILNSVQLNNIKAVQSLEYNSSNSQNTYTASSFITCYAPSLIQSTPNICWAASMASIGRAITGNTISDITVAQNAFPNNWNRSALIDEAVYALFRSFMVQYTYHFNAPSDAVIINGISANRPIYGHWLSSYSNHATVIFGIDAIGGYLLMMNPTQGSTQSAYLSGGMYKFTDISTSQEFRLIYYAN